MTRIGNRIKYLTFDACNRTTGGLKPQRKPKDDDRNTLLVTGLSSQTAATEIKAVFKRHGKVAGGYY
jgi:hypothetical protein